MKAIAEGTTVLKEDVEEVLGKRRRRKKNTRREEEQEQEDGGRTKRQLTYSLSSNTHD